MSSKLQNKKFLSKHHLSTNDNLVIQNQASTFGYYERQLEENIKLIMDKYPCHDKQKVRDLLEEIDNNKDLAIELLDAEEIRCNVILEEKKRDIKKPPALSKDQQNSILKHSFLNLYRKFLGVTKEIEEMTKRNESLKQQNCKLKQMNKILLEGEYSRNTFEDCTPIC